MSRRRGQDGFWRQSPQGTACSGRQLEENLDANFFRNRIALAMQEISAGSDRFAPRMD
jgi:hypothetical protein